MNTINIRTNGVAGFIFSLPVVESTTLVVITLIKGGSMFFKNTSQLIETLQIVLSGWMMDQPDPKCSETTRTDGKNGILQ
jgi:hypothetical protein